MGFRDVELKPSALVPEGSSRVLTATLVDLDGAPLAGSRVDSILFSLRDGATGAVVNGRNRVEMFAVVPPVAGPAPATVSEAGVFRLALSPADAQAIGSRRIQKRRLLLEVSYDAGANAENFEFLFEVENLVDVA